jgi:predicted nucleotidyltransferase
MHIDAPALEAVLSILHAYLPEYEVWAFGSRVHGCNLKPFSDLDLVVISAKPLDLLKLADVKDAFIESDLPFKVDLLDWATVKEPFRRIIEKDHVLVKRALTQEKK